MPVMTNPLIANAGRLAAGDTMSVANLVKGAQLGFGNHLSRMDAATPLVMRPLIGIVTHVPTMFQYLPNFPETLKALMEEHTIAMDGVDVEYTTDSDEVPAGQDSQNWAVPTNGKRTPISPSARMYEVNGNLVWNFFTTWQKMCKDPDTQAAALAGVVSPDTKLDPHVFSMWTMDMLWLQYSTDLRPENLIDAYFTVGMWPYSSGPAGYTKELGTSTVPTRNIQFHGVLQHSKNTRIIGQRIASALELHRVDYNFAPPVATDVEARVQNDGIAAEAAQDMSEFGPMGANAALD